MSQTGFNRLAFPAILPMHDDLGASGARLLRGRVGRAVVEHEDVVELRPRPVRNHANMGRFVIRRDDSGDVAAIKRWDR